MLGAQEFIAINLKNIATNLKGVLEPEIEFLLLRLGSRQPHEHAGCKRIYSH